MAETEKLFNDDSYLTSFKGKVARVDGNIVELDQTAFFPEGGGQVGDTGVLGGVRVVDTKKDNETIWHILEAPPVFGVGDTVDGEVDWERRYQVMKLHSAAHIMEYFLWQSIGMMDRVGSRVDEKKDRADYVYEGRLPVEGLAKAQEDTNAFLSEGHEITIRHDPKRPEIRIWRCGPVEMPCGGTHVRNTSEIGAVKLKRKNPGKGVERVETSLA
jgi:Ser-tRNA(Ala) deacylase AlaX